MKILCVARNYGAHAAELHNATPTEPVFFLKPDSSLLPKNQPFFYPDFSNDVQHELEIVVRIDKVGKCIEERFASRYYSEVALGLDFTARDLQQQAKTAGLPWLLSKGFDGAAVVSPFVPLDSLGKDVQQLQFSLSRNGEVVQCGNTGEMIFPVNRLISYVSRFMTLKTGDLIFTGTPSGVGPVKIGDVLVGELEGRQLLRCRVK